ncbi:MAG: FAD-binding protein, partial [Acidobacteria bacterium]|nr:FAD-binding protein [Acidobacteriota bacterium]
MKRGKGMGSRRKFLKELSGVAVGAAAASSVPMVGYSSQGAATEWASTYDWICVGCITDGLEAAIFGHDNGLKTLLLEESEWIGYPVINPAGIPYVPMNYLMKEAGIPDSREEALSWMRYVGGGYNSSEFIEAFVDNAPRAIEHLHRKADVQFRISEMIDFWAPFSEGGWRLNESIAVGSKKLGRSIIVEPFPAETLGEWRDKVRLFECYDIFQELLEG